MHFFRSETTMYEATKSSEDGDEVEQRCGKEGAIDKSTIMHQVVP